MQIATDGFKGMDGKMKDFVNTTGKSGAATKTMAATWGMAWSKMQARIEKFQIMFGEMLIPILEAVIPVIEDIFAMIEDLPWDKFQAAVADLGNEISEAFGGAGKSALEGFIKSGFKFLMLLVEAIKTVVKLYKAIADTGALEVLKTFLDVVLEGLKWVLIGWQKLAVLVSQVSKLLGLAGSDAAEAGRQQIKAMEDVEKKRKEHNSERAKEKRKAKHEERFEMHVGKAKGMETDAALEFLAMELGYKREERFSVAEMMSLFKSGDLAKMKGVNMGEDLGVIASAIAAVLGKEEKTVADAKQQFLEMGIDAATIEKMAKGLGLTSKELLGRVGKGDLTLVEVMRGHFGFKETERILAMGKANAE